MTLINLLHDIKDRYQRSEIWKAIRMRNDDLPVYKVMIVNQSNRNMEERKFVQLKEAVDYVYPRCKTMYNHEFYIYKDGKFLILYPVNQ
jgi:hypothetical protein